MNYISNYSGRYTSNYFLLPQYNFSPRIKAISDGTQYNQKASKVNKKKIPPPSETINEYPIPGIDRTINNIPIMCCVFFVCIFCIVTVYQILSVSIINKIQYALNN